MNVRLSSVGGASNPQLCAIVCSHPWARLCSWLSESLGHLRGVSAALCVIGQTTEQLVVNSLSVGLLPSTLHSQANVNFADDE